MLQIYSGILRGRAINPASIHARPGWILAVGLPGASASPQEPQAQAGDQDNDHATLRICRSAVGQTHSGCRHRATIEMFERAADSTSASFSSRSVLSRIHRYDPKMRLYRNFDCAHTNYRHVKTHVLARLATLTIIASPPSAPPRLMLSFVPSNASTANTVPFFTITVWPISSWLTSRAISNPYRASSSRRVYFRPGDQPACGRNSSRKVVAGRSSMPILPIHPRSRRKAIPHSAFSIARHHQRFQVRPQVEEILRRDLSSHDGIRDSRAPEGGDQFRQLADPHPVDFIHFAGKTIVGFNR